MPIGSGGLAPARTMPRTSGRSGSNRSATAQIGHVAAFVEPTCSRHVGLVTWHTLLGVRQREQYVAMAGLGCAPAEQIFAVCTRRWNSRPRGGGIGPLHVAA